MKKIIVLVGILIFGLQACYNDNEEELYPQAAGGGCDTSNITYSGTIAKIMNQRCALAGCHIGTSGQTYGTFSNHADLKSFLDTKKANFIGAINQTGGYTAMPLSGGKLPACDIQKIELWINAGYPNN